MAGAVCSTEQEPDSGRDDARPGREIRRRLGTLFEPEGSRILCGAAGRSVRPVAKASEIITARAGKQRPLMVASHNTGVADVI